MRAPLLFLVLFGVVFLSTPSILAAVTTKDGNKLDVEKETKKVDDSKYYCGKYGCCGWYGHQCGRCCSSPEEAKLMNSDAMPQNSADQVNDMKNPDGGNGGWYGSGGHGGGHGGGGGGGGHGGGHGGGGHGGGHGGGGHGGGHGGGGHGGGHGGGWSGGGGGGGN
ncbi:hypothetical protein Pint_01908 [Pistacia integerrima]|uniref:Uncharacterized protein n=1 Tax=Pistacia integerrima TaxID=434235 RepID=A0ACC0ZLZ0_9ROSI|nr:hypothetical protein Pint_01908 [Pistacia integerrima]